MKGLVHDVDFFLSGSHISTHLPRSSKVLTLPSGVHASVESLSKVFLRQPLRFCTMNDRNVFLDLVPFFAMMKKLPRVFQISVGKNPI